MVLSLSIIRRGSGSLVPMSRTESDAARIVGERIAAARGSVGATRLDLAYHARVDPANLARYETGKALPNLGTLIRLAETLGIDAGSLVTGLRYADFPQDRETPQPLPRPRKSSTA